MFSYWNCFRFRRKSLISCQCNWNLFLYGDSLTNDSIRMWFISRFSNIIPHSLSPRASCKMSWRHYSSIQNLFLQKAFWLSPWSLENRLQWKDVHGDFKQETENWNYDWIKYYSWLKSFFTLSLKRSVNCFRINGTWSCRIWDKSPGKVFRHF